LCLRTKRIIKIRDKTIKLHFAKKKQTKSRLPQLKTKATDILYDKMITYDTKAKDILNALISSLKSQEKAQFDKIKAMYLQMRQCDDIVIDCAHKLAPYQSPKLESVEVNKKVEHRYVLQVPQPMKTKEDWMNHVGATKIKSEEMTRDLPATSKIAPSVHDFSEDEDELETYKQTIN